MASVVSGPVARSKRRLLLHDGVAFVVLLASAMVLFTVTLFFFRSFESHRAELARRWAERGRTAMQQHQADAAVSAFRTALSYAPDERDDQFLLAQALADAGHTEEATNYFLALWEQRPGDGFINLELARLARKKGETPQAVEYYRASIFGSWEGDGVARRRVVRLELIDFLLEKRLFSQARNELLIVAGNAPNDLALNLTVGEKLEAAGFANDALSFDRKALALDPHNRSALERAGRISYKLGEYAAAEELLKRALAEKPPAGGDVVQERVLAGMAEDARRMQELTLSPDQPAVTRTEHLLEALPVASNRLKGCTANAPADIAAVATLNASWAPAAGGTRKVRGLLHTAAAQDYWTQLIYRTERETARICGAPEGDDRLLLTLANAGSGE